MSRGQVRGQVGGAPGHVTRAKSFIHSTHRRSSNPDRSEISPSDSPKYFTRRYHSVRGGSFVSNVNKTLVESTESAEYSAQAETGHYTNCQVYVDERNTTTVAPHPLGNHRPPHPRRQSMLAGDFGVPRCSQEHKTTRAAAADFHQHSVAGHCRTGNESGDEEYSSEEELDGCIRIEEEEAEAEEVDGYMRIETQRRISNFYHPGSPGQYLKSQSPPPASLKTLERRLRNSAVYSGPADESQDFSEYTDMSGRMGVSRQNELNAQGTVAVSMKINGLNNAPLPHPHRRRNSDWIIHGSGNRNGAGNGNRGDLGNGNGIGGDFGTGNGNRGDLGNGNENGCDFGAGNGVCDMIPSTPPPLPPSGVPPLRLKRFQRSQSQRSTKENTSSASKKIANGTPLRGRRPAMGFGTELQASHDALVRLGDAELRLLDCVRRVVTQRVRCDRDYAAALAATVATATKHLGGSTDPAQHEFSGPLFQAWSEIVNETGNLASHLKENADSLSTGMLEKLASLISEKRSTQKHYTDERQRLENEFQKAQDAVTKQKSEYSKQLSKAAAERTKYEDLLAKGKGGSKGGSKVEDAQRKYEKATGKAHRAHNDYVCSLHEASLQQRAYLRKTLPALLDHHQEQQHAMVESCKQLLKEYAELTSTNNDKFMTCHNNINKMVEVISPQAEYDDFVNKHKSDPIPSLKFDFDTSLLNDYKGSLVANEIALDELTVDSVTINKNLFSERMVLCQQSLKTKREELQRREAELENVPPVEDMDITQRTQFAMSKRAVALLQKEITEAGCTEEKWQTLHDLLNARLQATPLPPPALTFDDTGTATTDSSGSGGGGSAARSGTSAAAEDAGGGGGGPSGITDRFNTVKSTFSNAFKRNNVFNAPKPPSKDFLDTNKANGTPGKERAPNNGYQEMTLQPGGRAMDEEEWYHGVLPRDEVQRLLQADGDYLVRQSNSKKTGDVQYVLSVYWTGGGTGKESGTSPYKHFIIQGGDQQWRFEGDPYPTIQELIIAQHKSQQPVTKKSEAVLLRPVMREKWELNNDDVTTGMKIGDGNFGCVYKGTLKGHVGPVAIKTCKETLSDDLKKKFLQEGRILKQYNHENIVRFIGIAATRQPVMILMEFVSGGALNKHLRKHGASKSSKQMMKMCMDAAAGMAYLEGNNCIHRDLAARNCLVGDNDTVKISDFGMSREEEEYTVSGGLKQIPIKWTAPEALHFARYTSACDVWSYGILMWEIFSLGSTPYPGLTNSQAREKIDEGYRMPAPDSMPASVAAVMAACWEAEAADRPKFEKIYADLNTLYQAA